MSRRGAIVQLSPVDARARALSAWTGVTLAIASMLILAAAVTITATVLRLRGGGPATGHSGPPALACLALLWASWAWEGSRAQIHALRTAPWMRWVAGSAAVALLLLGWADPTTADLATWPLRIAGLILLVGLVSIVGSRAWRRWAASQGPRRELLASLSGASLLGLVAAAGWAAAAVQVWWVDGPAGTAWIVAALLQFLGALAVGGVSALLWARAWRGETGRLFLGVDVCAAWAHSQLALSALVAVALFFW